MSAMPWAYGCLASVLENLPLGVALNTLDVRSLTYANPLFKKIYGQWCHGEFLDLDTFLTLACPQELNPADIQKQIVDEFPSSLFQGDQPAAQVKEIRIPGGIGGQKIVSVGTIPLPDLNLVISTAMDVTDQRLTEQSLQGSERRYHLMAEASPVGIFRLGPDGVYRSVNKAWREISGITESQALGHNWDLAIHQDDRQDVREQWQSALDQDRSIKIECRFRRPEGRSVWVFLQADRLADETGQLEGFIGSVTDISLHKRSEEEIRQLAYYDTLTRLPNRSFFMEQLDRAMATALRNESLVALLFCDLDNFKDVNDSLGHDKGDLLLQQIGIRLNSCIRRGDTLCRLGGDEFVLLLPSLARPAEAAAVARKIQKALIPAFDLAGQEVFSRASIGIAICPDDGADVQTLLKHADMAMYAAKGTGRNRYRFFSEEMNRSTVARMKMDAGLRQALAKDELSLAWQPQFDLADGKLTGVEALLRWKNDELGIVPPAKFIPLAEETGLIHEIGAWVLREACGQMQKWRKIGGPPLRVAVNLSASQFREPGIIDLVRSVLAEKGLDPSLLELEITESVLMGDTDATMATLRTLRKDGVGLAIDDFGTGYSSLVYLKNLPVGRIKIARNFVRDITTNPRDEAIAGTIINMASSLSMKALAEGVETKEQADRLRALGCPEVQGFFFSRPLTADDFQSLLLSSRQAEG